MSFSGQWYCLVFRLSALFFFSLFISSTFAQADPAPAAQPDKKNEYVLQAGDVIAVNVVDHSEFSVKTRIRPDGMINYPILGDIECGGVTTDQLVKIMEEKLAPYVNNVVVSISIEAYFSNKIYILGDVGRSGQFEIYAPIDVLKALALCGGLNNKRNRFLKVVRSNGEISQIDMMTAIGKSGATKEEQFLLYPGDTLFVPEKFKIPWAMIATILSVISLSITLTFTLISLGS